MKYMRLLPSRLDQFTPRNNYGIMGLSATNTGAYLHVYPPPIFLHIFFSTSCYIIKR